MVVPIIQNSAPHAEHYIHEHLHSASLIAPTAAGPITVTAGALWTPGNFSNDFIAADAVANVFDIHWTIIINLTESTWYELIFYYGAGDIECGRCAFAKQNNFLASLSIPMMTKLIPGSSRIRAKVMAGIAGAAVDAKIFYHTYD